VEKFRSIEAMNAAPVRANPQGAFRRFIRHCERYQAISYVLSEVSCSEKQSFPENSFDALLATDAKGKARKQSKP
jgi:hypothetical protein